MDALERRNGVRAFSLSDIVQQVQSQTNAFKESTIRTHVTSRMCREAPANHAVVFADLERVGHGMYRRIR